MKTERNKLKTRIHRCVRVLRKACRRPPALAIILGSGFKSLLAEFEGVQIHYSRLPGFPIPSVSGHAPVLTISDKEGIPVLILGGRAHYYEGFSMDEVTFPIRVLAHYGVKIVMLTNAAGGINRNFKPGDLMLIRDHINLMGTNPLRESVFVGESDRFVDLTDAYDPTLRKLLKQAAQSQKIKLQEGIYLAVSGPTYETPAEIEAFARLGADAVGMSTVPETIVARHCGMKVVALSCITNMAAGRSSAPLSHEEVISTSSKIKTTVVTLIKAFIKLLAAHDAWCIN